MQTSASNQLTQPGLALRVLFFQGTLTIVASVAAMPLGLPSALSVLVGGAVCLAASAAVVPMLFRDYRAQAPGTLVSRFYGAEAVKIALLIGLFAAAFATIDGLHLPLVLVSYFAVQVLPPIIAAQGATRPNPPNQVR